MADITKMLLDDHARLRRMFKAFVWGTYDQAMTICDELIIHSTIEEELFYAPMREDMDASLADKAEDDHDRIKQLMAEVIELDPDDPALARAVSRLKEEVLRHLEYEEEVLFPKFNARFADDLYERGRDVFALRQELLAVKPDRSGPLLSAQRGTANTGWGKSQRRSASETANLGW